MISLCFTIYIYFLSISINYSYSLYKNINFFKKFDFFNKLNNYNSNINKYPIILDGDVSSLKKDFCRIYCDINNIQFKPYNFNNFILKQPHLKYTNSMIYIPDYLIKNGRILDIYEKEMILGMSQTSNMIIFETDNIDKISFKDNDLNSRFSKIKFSNIKKKDYIRYIYDVIFFYKYNDDLLILDWNEYNIDKLDFERINILLFELNDMLENNLAILNLNEYIEFIINGLSNTYNDLNKINSK